MRLLYVWQSVSLFRDNYSFFHLISGSNIRHKTLLNITVPHLLTETFHLLINIWCLLQLPLLIFEQSSLGCTRGSRFVMLCSSLLPVFDPHLPGLEYHDDVIKWKHFHRHWSFVREIHRSAGNSPQRPVTGSFDVFFDLTVNKRLSKQPWGWWFETHSPPLWRHSNVLG